MEEKGAMPPSYPTVILPSDAEHKKSKKWMFGLLFYAGAITATLITLAIVGSLYLNKVESSCTQMKELDDNNSDNNKKYNYKDEEFEVDEEADKEIIKLTGDHYGKGSIVVHDFKKGVTGVYNARTDECYLIGGIDERLPSARELSQQFESMADEHMNLDNTTVHYGKTTDRPVKDLSLLPRELHDVCWGKEVYWLERMAEKGPSEESSRHKRWVCPAGDVLVRYNGCQWYCCDFCLVYSNGYTQCYTCSYLGYNCNRK
nr:integral membrane protein 2 [Arenicola marina]